MTISKAVAAAALALLATLFSALSSGGVSGGELILIVGTTVGAAGAVFTVPNLSVGVAKYGKETVAVLLAGIGTLGTAYADHHVTGQEWVLILGVMVATGVGLPFLPAPTHITTFSDPNHPELYAGPRGGVH